LFQPLFLILSIYTSDIIITPIMMNKFTISLILLNIIILTTTSCKRNNTFYLNDVEIKNGDLLFQQSVETPLEDAISSVTYTNGEKYSFTHVGIVYKVNNEFYVIEAAPSKVKITPINKFLLGHIEDKKEYNNNNCTKDCNLNRCNEEINFGTNNNYLNQNLEPQTPCNFQLITVPARLKKEYQHLIKPALKNAQKYINMDYDYEYLPNNNKMYCSELIYLIFKEANKGDPIFEAKPMTFKVYDKDTDSSYFHPLWIKHYKKLNIPIPEGEIGTNPADMAKSDLIEFLTN
jgi:hypothetical protein